MARLIDANALIEFFGRPEDDRDRSINHIIDKAPTIDAVEVVRCKDCASRGTVECPLGYAVEWGIGNDFPADEDFCSYAIRKEEHNGKDD